MTCCEIGEQDWIGDINVPINTDTIIEKLQTYQKLMDTCSKK
ncbi:MAG: hypothetical protein ACRCWI_06525 [Brevinema sp.]